MSAPLLGGEAELSKARLNNDASCSDLMGALCKVPVLCVYNILYTLTYSSGFVRLPHLAVKPVLVPAHPQTLLTSV